MKDLQTSAKSALEYGVVVTLVLIIIAGSYKLYKDWTNPKTEKTHNFYNTNKIFEKKDFCEYVVNQCKAKYNIESAE